jgi:class 3 adenylate cyclase
MVASVACKIKDYFRQFEAAVGFASAARGGDILFLEALQEFGIEAQVVLPLERDAFAESSVAGGQQSWIERYQAALAGAKSVRIANSNSSASDGVAFEYGTRFLIGLALMRAAQLETEVRAVVLWDGNRGDGHGGTAWSVGHMLRLGIPIHNVHPSHEGAVCDSGFAALPDRELPRPIRALFFSDCKGYSKLREEQISEYTKLFLSGVAQVISELSEQDGVPIASNTWGDGLFLAFREVGAAARFALALLKSANADAEDSVFPQGITLRIALHAGPVMPFMDPVTGRQNFAGVNVALTARMEPIARENQVCVSEPFAALAMAEGLKQFHFDYLGNTGLAKGYGTFPLYQLRSLENCPAD